MCLNSEAPVQVTQLELEGEEEEKLELAGVLAQAGIIEASLP